MDETDRPDRSGGGKSGNDSSASLTIVMLLLFPALLHIAAITLGFLRTGAFIFEKLDLLFLLLLCLYLSLVAVVIRRRELARKFVLLVYSVFISIAAIEFVAYLLGGGSGEDLPWPPMRKVSTAANTMPGITGEIVFTVNDMGVRAPDHWPKSRDMRVLCVGGSTTECISVTDEKSWPWLLGTKLTEEVGRPVLVANAGRSGDFTLNHFHLLRRYRHADEFGLVIVLCGINDAGTLLRGNYDERAAALETWISTEGAYYRDSWLIRSLRALRDRPVETEGSVKQDLEGEWYAGLRQKRQRLLQENQIDRVPAGLEAHLKKYRSNIKAIIDLCSERNQRLVFMTQPTLWHEGMADDLAALIWQHSENGAHTPEVLSKVMSAYNATLKSVCEENMVPCVDLAAKLPKDTTIFYDDCHFNVSGCDKVSGVLCEFLKGNLIITKADNLGEARQEDPEDENGLRN